MAYSLTATPDEELYSMGPTETALSGEAAKDRAFRLDVALGEDSPGMEKLTTDVASGVEDPYRDLLANREMATRLEAGKQLVYDNVVANPEFTTEQAQAVMDPGEPPNKDTVVEEQFMKKAMDAIMAAGTPEEIEKAMVENPMGFDKKYAAYEDIIFKNLIASKWEQKIDAEVAAMGWYNYVPYFAVTLTGFAPWANLVRNKEGGIETSAWSTPGALEERIASIRALPPAQMDQAIKAEVEALKQVNPLDAQKFVKALSSYSASDASFDFIDNLFSLPVAGALAKGGKITRNLKEALEIRRAAKAPRRLTEAQEVRPGTPIADKDYKAAQSASEAPQKGPTWGTLTPEYFKDGKKLRLYRGEGNNMGPSGPQAFYTTDPDKAAQYGEVSYVDVTQDELKSFIQGHGGKDEFVSDNAGIRGRLKPLRAETFGPRLVTDTAIENELEAISNALSSKSIDIPSVLSGTGRIGEASQVALREEIAMAMLPNSPDAMQRTFASMLRRTSSLIKPTVISNTGDNFYARTLDDLMGYQRRAVELLVSSARLNRVQRAPEQIQQQAADMAIQALGKEFGSSTKSIMDVRSILPGQSALNVGQIAVTFGDADRQAFQSFEAANRYITTLGLSRDATVVKPVGGKYVIETYTDVGEDGISSMVLTPENKPRNNSWTALRGYLGSKMQTSDFQSAQRGSVTHGETALGIMLREVYEPYEKLGKRSRKAIDEIMRVNMETEKIPGDHNTRGMFYHTEAELEEGFMKHLKRPPTQKEIDAYFAVRRAQDIDYLYRSLSQYRMKASEGFSQFTLRRRISKDEYAHNNIEGRVVAGLPENRPDVNVLVIKEDGMVETFNLKTAANNYVAQLKKRMDSGEFSVIQPFQPRDPNLLKTAGDQKPIAFVVSEQTFSKKPLRLDKQVNYRQGFHNEYKAEWYVKQPRVLDGRFEGDTTAMGFMTEAEAAKYGSKMEEARKLLRDGKTNELDAFLKKNLPFDRKKFRSLFDEHLNLDTPFTVVKRNTKSYNSGRKLLNGSDFSTHFGKVSTELDDFYNPSARFGDPFVAKRDPLVMSVKESGTEDSPVFELKTAELLSPMLAQTRAMGKLIKSELYNDYQLSSANHWVEEFADDLLYENSPLTREQIRRNPLYYLANGTFNPKTNPKRAAQGEQLRLAIQQLLGQPSEYALHLDHFKGKMLNGVYNRLGQEYLQYVPENMIPMIQDPLTFMRSVAFHSKLGLFNPVQFFIQASSVMNITAIAYKHAPLSFAASTLMRGLRLTESATIIDKYGDIAAKLPGWTKEKFIESKRLLDTTGFDRVGGEYSWRSDFGDPNLYRGPTGRFFLDKGPMFFNAGERATRLTAWNTAYLEYADKFAKKVGQMDAHDIGKIRARAQALSANMTRDNNSFWQNGLAGNFTQFWSYNVRMAELMIGHELTGWEKARLALAQGFLWGANPLTVGIYAAQNNDPAALESILPWGEDIKVHAINNGMDLDDQAIGAIQNGIISTVFGMITGEEWDFGSRYGMSPIKVHETIAKNFRENNPVRALIVSGLGPSGSIINDMLKESGNVTRDLLNAATGEEEYASLLPMDLANAFREIASVNLATKLHAAAAGTFYYSQNGNIMSNNEDPAAEITKALFGVQDMDEALAFSLTNSAKAEQLDKDAYKKYLQRLQVRMVDALHSGDTALYKKWMDTIAALIQTSPLTHGERMNVLYPDSSAEQSIDQYIFRDYPTRVPEERRENVQRALQNRIE